MSDEKELPERVWIKPDLKVEEGEIPVWFPEEIAEEGDVPYLRADKPDKYRIVAPNGAVLEVDTEAEARRVVHTGDTVYPVYIGPAIEPEEESDE